MTQQQIAYYNAQTARQQLDASLIQADAARRQARVAEDRYAWDTTIGWGTNLATGAISSIGGIIAMALI